MKFVAASAVEVERRFCAEILRNSADVILVSIQTLFYWGEIEAGLALVACCLPTLKPLLGRFKSLSSVISLQYVNSGRSRTENSNSTWTGNHRSNVYNKIDPATTDEGLLRRHVISEWSCGAAPGRLEEPERVLKVGEIRVRRESSIREDLV
jgi:hypothetical protein